MNPRSHTYNTAAAMTLAVRPTSQAGGNAAKRVIDTTPGPWKSWRIRSRHGRAIKFIETYCRAPKGMGHGRPMKLATFQKEWFEEILADGVNAAVKSTPRGNGKSTEGGALTVWATFDDDETGAPQVPIVATTIGQAVRSCYGVAVSMIRAEPELIRRSLIYTGIATPRVTVPFNGGELFPIANATDGLQGLDPSLGLFDEIGFQPIESWESLRMASGKRARSLIIGLGTPGLDRSNALFHLRQLVREGAALPGFIFREYAAPDGAALDDRDAWRRANPALRARFLQMAALETDLALAPEGHFRIFRLGQWWEGVDAWLGPDGNKVWADLTDPWEFVAHAPTWAGVDFDQRRESAALTAVQRRPDGQLHAKSWPWISVEANEVVDVSDVMHRVREVATEYDLQAVSYDPRSFDLPAQILFDEGLPMVPIPESVERMTPIIGNLFGMIQRGEMHHDGDPALATQVLNAVPRYSERGFTLSKTKSRGRIQAAIALALAIDRANAKSEVNPEPGFLSYWRTLAKAAPVENVETVAPLASSEPVPPCGALYRAPGPSIQGCTLPAGHAGGHGP